jgi:hypothetical protein
MKHKSISHNKQKMDCTICALPLNGSTHKAIAFNCCGLRACKACVRQFLMTDHKMPRCMNCAVTLKKDFLVEHLNFTWVKQVYTPFHGETLLQLALKRLPAAIPLAEAEQKRSELREQNAKFEIEITKLTRQVTRLRDAQRANEYRIRGEDVPPRFRNELVEGTGIVADVKKKFTMRCPNGGCNGFLSTAYKCGLCNYDTCSECLVVLKDKTVAHVCVESDKLSAKMIKAETRPCPTCGQRIFKNGGCDQMFCTEPLQDGTGVCGTAFSYKTGEIEKGVIHNPHYYELMRLTGNNVPRNIGDVRCGGIPDIRPILRTLDTLIAIKTPAVEFRNLAINIHRRMSELTQYTVVDLRRKIRDLSESQDLLVEFILKKITQENLRDMLAKRDADLNKFTAIYDVMEIISMSGIECFRELVEICNTMTPATVVSLNASNPSIGAEILARLAASVDNLHKVRAFCNDLLKKKSVIFSCTVRTYDENFNPVSQKFTLKSVGGLLT